MRVLLTVVLLCSAAGPARAQLDSRDAIALQNQILELRRDLQAQRQGGGGGGRQASPGGASDLLPALLDRVATLEDQQRQLRGQVDQLRNQLQRQSEDLGKQISDLGFQVQNNGGSSARSASPSLGPSPGSPPGSSRGDALGGSSLGAAPARRTPELAMQDGNAALARRDYPAAAAAAREVLAMPRTPRAVDAQFLLAQAESGQRNYAAAAPDFYDAYSRSRTGSRAQDALLGVANSLIALNDKRSACDALDKLRSEFPQPRADIREAVSGARQRAGCR